MFRRFVFSSVGAIALLIVLGAPAEVHAQRMRGGFTRQMHPGFRNGFGPGFQGRFNPRFHRGPTNLRMSPAFFSNRPGFMSPRFNRQFVSPGFMPAVRPGSLVTPGVRPGMFPPF
jgi:hypothetical protein